ncbi:TPA: hypothetical protein ACMDRZ_003221 [Vibrio cholerae]|uniref:hypothetical protein n=1 Tax=Vibrio cholerae TaxID=666 RepID=UPI001581DAA8|nr:hypothetical protein [Vibrio cholerae]EKA4522890.1 hypothetical protein [Vibrio cholerae]QKU65497.1 hypothetical protein HPY17_19445 [Vibrio cholerae]
MNLKAVLNKKYYLLWRIGVPSVFLLASLIASNIGAINPLNPLSFLPFYSDNRTLVESLYIGAIGILYLLLDDKVTAFINKKEGVTQDEVQTEETDFEHFGSVLVLAITPGRTTIETEDYILTIVGEIPIIKKGCPLQLCKKTKQVKIRERVYRLVS